MTIMVTRLNSFPIVFIILSSFIYGYFAGKNFNIVLTDIQCKHNTKYAANSSCLLNGTKPASGANFYMQMKSQIKDFRLDLIFYMERKKSSYLLFKAPDVDVCTEFHKNITVLYLQMFKDMTLRAGKWPKCPIPADFYYKFENLSPSLKYLPDFAPNIAFKMVLVMKNKKEAFLDVSVLGNVVHKKGLPNKRKH